MKTTRRFTLLAVLWLAVTMMLLCAGACAAGGQFSITAAYYHAPASKISIYDYSQILFSTLFGLVFFGQFPDWMSLIGYIIIISMAIVNYIYTHRHAEAAEVEDTSESAESSPAPAPQESN